MPVKDEVEDGPAVVAERLPEMVAKYGAPETERLIAVAAHLVFDWWVEAGSRRINHGAMAVDAWLGDRSVVNVVTMFEADPVSAVDDIACNYDKLADVMDHWGRLGSEPKLTADIARGMRAAIKHAVFKPVVRSMLEKYLAWVKEKESSNAR